jgi:hypothetical protein
VAATMTTGTLQILDLDCADKKITDFLPDNEQELRTQPGSAA